MRRKIISARTRYDLIFADVRLPDGSGDRPLAAPVGDNSPKAPSVIMMTGHGSIESAVECMRAGAFDYIIKPFSLSQITMIVEKAEDFQSGRQGQPISQPGAGAGQRA